MRGLTILALFLTLVNFGCATMRRHPVLTAIIVTVPTVALTTYYTTKRCAKVYDGKPYDGTPPCPK